MNTDKFYFDRLPKFANILKQKLKEQLDNKLSLTIKDHIIIFLDFYEEHDAYFYFKDYNLNRDRMLIEINLSSFENSIYIDRKIRIEDDDEEYQIQFELLFELPYFGNRTNESYEIDRRESGRFSSQKFEDLQFLDFQENVLSSNNIINLLNLYPLSIRINLNADV